MGVREERVEFLEFLRCGVNFDCGSGGGENNDDDNDDNDDDARQYIGAFFKEEVGAVAVVVPAGSWTP